MGRMLALMMSALATAGASAAPPPSPPQFHVLRTSDGSPSNMPQAIAQDGDGFLWIGTRQGLARYDGISFRHWQHDPRDPGSLADNDITSLLVDRRGRLWCATEGGGVALMLDDGRFRSFRHMDGDAASLGSDDVLALAADSDGSIWVGTYLGGLGRIHADGRVERIEPSAEATGGLRSNFIISLLFDAHGRLWIGSDAGLDVRTPDGRIRPVALPPIGAKKVPASMVAALYADADGDVLVGLRGGVVRVGADLLVKGQVGAPINATVTAFARGNDGQLWATTTQGLVRAEGDEWQLFAAGEQARGEVPGTRAFDALRDREGNLWFAFVDGGIARLSSEAEPFAVWRHRMGDPASLAHSRLSGVAAAPRGGAWVISDNDGLDRLAADGSVTRHGARIPNDAALRSIAATDAHVFVGRWRGIVRYTPVDGRVDELPAGKGAEALPEAPVVLLRVAPDGALWAVARSGGVSRIDPRTLVVRTYSPALGTLGHADITALRFDREGQPWTVGSHGFERFDARAERFVPVAGPTSRVIEAFAFAADGSLWLHRLGSLEHHRLGVDGLERLDVIDVDDGWPSIESRDLHVAADGHVWVASFQGLWRVDPATRQLRRFGEADGLPSIELAGGPLAAAADGTVYAATLGGLVAFDPGHVVGRTSAPSPRITAVSLRRDGQTVDLDPHRGEIAVGHADRDLLVQARSLSFSAPGADRFSFRAHPYESEWVDAGVAGERLFSQLPAGLHTLSVRVTDADGNESEMADPLRVRVAPAPWRHPLAWLAYAALAVLAGAFALRVQRRRVEQRHALAIAGEQRHQAERLGASKSAFLATMSHEIRTPMTSMLGMAELLQLTPLDPRQRGYAEAISSSGELLLRLVNDSLDLARIEAGKLALEPRVFDPVALVGEVVALEQALAARNHLELRVEHGEDLPPFVLGDPLRIKQVLLNLLGNALKFTERGGVSMGLSRAPAGGLAFAVSDSGPGLAPDMLERLFGRFEQSVGISQRFGGSGLGLAITRELVELMDGRIVVDSTPGSGTTFTVELPLADVPAPLTPVAVAAATTQRALVVLVVEDDATIARVLAGLLESLGHDVRHAPNGLAALAELEHEPVDVALVDLDLPGIDGLQLARVVRQREAANGHRLPLVAISARALGNEEEQSHAAGMDAFLRKPVTAAMLEATLAPWTAQAPPGPLRAGD
jgi:signal transduction histidine kinase/CheY-like chemotaxis protein